MAVKLQVTGLWHVNVVLEPEWARVPRSRQTAWMPRSRQKEDVEIRVVLTNAHGEQVATEFHAVRDQFERDVDRIVEVAVTDAVRRVLEPLIADLKDQFTDAVLAGRW